MTVDSPDTDPMTMTREELIAAVRELRAEIETIEVLAEDREMWGDSDDW